jgi:hypothetical protein
MFRRLAPLIVLVVAGCLNGRQPDCVDATDCATDSFCSSGSCKQKLVVGGSCTSPNDCFTGFCADGVCCATVCARQCHACNIAGAVGRCVPVPDGEDVHNDCPADPSTTCLRAGGCDGRGSCRVYPMGTACRAPMCGGTNATAPGTCDGRGMCLATGATAPSTKDCGAYACAIDGTCATSCAIDRDCSQGYACRRGACVLAGGLVLHLKLDETSGTVAADSSGNDLHGQYIGVDGLAVPSAQVPPSKFDNPRSLAFSAAKRHAVRVPNMAAVLKPATNITIAAWYRATMVDVDAMGVAPTGSELVTAGNSYLLRVRATQIEVSKRTMPATGTARFVQCFGMVPNHLDGNWHHLAGIHSPEGMKLYFDGVERCSMAQPDPIGYDQGPDLFLGRHGNGQVTWDLDGNLDEVRIYNRVLSPAEIMYLASGGG